MPCSQFAVDFISGKLLELLGNLKDVDTRSKAILSTHEIDDSEFPQAVIESLPEMPFKIPDEEFAKRR